MTIAIAVRTGSAVVFAADSKVTTSGIVGIEESGDPRWVEQTYYNAVKVIHDSSRKFMALVAGDANIGQETAMDFIATKDFGDIETVADQDAKISSIVESMVNTKSEYWKKTKIEPKDWPGPTLLLAAAPSQGNAPRVWRVDLHGESSQIEEILTFPRIWLEGSYNEVFGLLYGYQPNILAEITDQGGIDPEKVAEIKQNLRVLRPIDKISLWSMPIQDAVDLAVFLAKVQVEMDRFLPGQPACGGPIDVMVLRVVPDRAIISFPGKVLHHPGV